MGVWIMLLEISGSTLTTLLAVWGAVVSTVAIAWNVWRDVGDRAKLSVICYVGVMIDPMNSGNRPLRLIWKVTNVGRKAAVLTHIGGAYEKRTNFMVKVMDLPKTLQPGEYYLGYANDLSILKQKPIAIWAIDSLDRYWKIPRKMLKALLERRDEDK